MNDNAENLKHLFLLSFEYRDPLAAEISTAGWRVSSARRSDDLEARFLSSNALIAVIDLRGGRDAGLAAVEDIAALAKEGGIALLAMGDQSTDSEIAEAAYKAGATHFFDTGNPNYSLSSAIDFAYRYVEHMRGGAEATRSFSRLLAQTDQQWSFPKADFSKAEISDVLRSNLPDIDFAKYPATGIYRQLSADERKRVRGAMGRLRDGSAQAAVPHMLAGKKVVHHLHNSDDRLFGRIETVDEASDIDVWTDRDLLSGLKNGKFARSWIGQRWQDESCIGLISLGIKNFRTINAAYGRSVGDQILRISGQRLLARSAELISDDHVVARLDGQNFLIAALIGSKSELTVIAEQLLDVLSKSIAVDNRYIQLIPRAGLALSTGESDETSFLRNTNLALAEAMASATNRIKFNSLSQGQIALEQDLEGQLVDAIENDDIAIVLQPQIKVQSGQLVGAEALARWEHPQYGMLGAATLFTVAERAGMMPLLSSHIHGRALVVASQWPDSLSFLRLSINVTAGDLAERNFVKQMRQKIGDSGFDATRTTLEITETELISDVAGSTEKLEQLRETGFKIAIDDFGTGYSSLAYLKRLPLDYLKIDSGLTSDISGSEKEQLVVRSIIDLARSLKLEVIAEGVETEAQLESLASQGCEYYQGFLRSGPLFPEEFEVFALRSN